MQRSRNVTVYLKLTLTAAFWGATFAAGRIVAQHLPPFSAAFLRFVIASCVLVPLLHARERRLPPFSPRRAIGIVLLGASGIFAYNAFFFLALRTIEASRASLIVATCPVLLALTSAVIFRERLTLRMGFGIALSVLGVALVVSRGHLGALAHGSVGRGELFIFGSVVSWTVYSLIGKSVMGGLSPLAAVTYSVIVGAALLAVPALSEGLVRHAAHAGPQTWAGLVYLALFGTVIGFVWYYDGIRRVGATAAGMFINLVPVCGVALGVVLLGEPLTWSLLAGGLLVIAGVYLTSSV